MNTLKRIFTAVILTFLSTASFALPAQIIIFPHADKAVNSPHLSAQGAAQAQTLKHFLLDIIHFKPDIVIANRTPHQRALGSIETCYPIAKAAQAPLRSQFLVSEYQAMLQTVLTDSAYTDKHVLICWDKHTMEAMNHILKANKNVDIVLLTPDGYSRGYFIKFKKEK